MIIVRCPQASTPKGAQKRKTADFRLKSHSCKGFIVLTIRTKMIGGGQCKISAIKALKVIQGHQGLYQSKVVCDFLLVIID